MPTEDITIKLDEDYRNPLPDLSGFFAVILLLLFRFLFTKHKTMKDFNYEEFKAGAKVQTRSGQTPNLIMKDDLPKYPILARFENGKKRRYGLSGHFMPKFDTMGNEISHVESKFDLFIVKSE